MSLGKASIKRASAAGKKTAEKKTTEQVQVPEETEAKFIPTEVKEEEKNRPVRLTEDMPTYLL